jgi:methylenetetrahydrofolate--tRNA-(uracil-5-)-methyltransferase
MNLRSDQCECEPSTAFYEPKAAAPPQVVRVIGGGLAGPEAALTAARLGCAVDLYEMRALVDGKPRLTPAHQTAEFGELVCSNSLKSESPNTAPWLLKQEMRRAGSALMRMADETPSR